MPTANAPDAAVTAQLPPLDVVAWVRLRDGELLHVRSHGSDAFYIPGGKREPGESDTQTLLREVREELGVELLPDTVTFLTTIVAPAHGRHAGRLVHMACYCAEPASGATEPAPGAEIAEIRWLRLHDAPQTAPADQALMAHLARCGLMGP
jgi:8-oxo-dGTP pyrophosphatase MutT (NUDIX family)